MASSEDFYKILGIPRTATKEQISDAYRKMARKYHPDHNPDDKTATKKFQQVQRAYETLNDPKKKELYDRFGENYEAYGNAGSGRGPSPGWGPGAGRTGAGPTWEGRSGRFQDFSDFFGQGASPGAQEAAGFSPEDLFGMFTGRTPGSARRGKRTPAKADNYELEITIPFTTSVLGGETQVAIQGSSGEIKTITAKIPPGIEDGKKLRLKGQANTNIPGQAPGDLVLIIRVTSHPVFTRVGNNLQMRLPVKISEAFLGAKVDVPTPQGEITINIPPLTSSGKKLRLKGRGITTKNGTGDLLVEIMIVAPEKVDDSQSAVLRQMDSAYSKNLRAGIKW